MSPRKASIEPTPRELQQLDEMSRGKSYLQAADALGIAEDTVRATMRRLYRRIGARDRSHAVSIAVYRGWLTVPPSTDRVDLTSDELLLLAFISTGRTYREIGPHTGVTEAIVQERAARLFPKLGVRDRTHAVRRGYELGLIRPLPSVGARG
ncbi:regulatory protein, luxR family [Lentzea albidocapillata subsp. violacea]|uniref:Regulatory protein, luxR family n=1 Tax=Lentzea albidocapillata subsp. violacea TaxID=128104 RepID=A0A1G9AWI3_9PSEU|nr:helix-turn-helix transcriptional regulator [Lentzea albidocapillata]SDK31234.1 regulatory protein, luxR family [Lentzea albidocapillata subsp. violacea]